jgi:polysaccharide pyruvyl transferase WcaK-like protein
LYCIIVFGYYFLLKGKSGYLTKQEGLWREFMRILIGTVPYGRDNVGDEAILATVVASIREYFPDADIIASTDDGEATAEKLKIKTLPLFCHNVPGATYSQMVDAVKWCDVYIWGGATGLSDYPENALEIADLALENGKKLVLYGCGMNSELNPAHYRLHSGPKKTILSLLGFFTGDVNRFVNAYQDRSEKKTMAHIQKSLNRASLIVVRDKETKQLLQDNCGVVTAVNAMADPAILLPLCSSERLNEIWEDKLGWDKDVDIVGIGISAQREVTSLDDIVALADYLVETHKVKILYLPMNPKTDAATMVKIREEMRNKGEASVLEGFYEPEEIAAFAAKTKLIISSRLHLLILATISKIPIVGLSRGSKIDNFLNRLGESSAGSVDDFDLSNIKNYCDRLIMNKAVYLKKSGRVIEEMKEQARESRKLLAEVLGESTLS